VRFFLMRREGRESVRGREKREWKMKETD